MWNARSLIVYALVCTLVQVLPVEGALFDYMKLPSWKKEGGAGEGIVEDADAPAAATTTTIATTSSDASKLRGVERREQQEQQQVAAPTVAEVETIPRQQFVVPIVDESTVQIVEKPGETMRIKWVIHS